MNQPLPPSNPLEPTIFHESWWLDLATRGRWQAAEIMENGRVMARLPYFMRKAGPVRCLVMPPLTHFWGPVVLEGDGSPNTRFLRRTELTRELAEKLPSFSGCTIKCHGGVTDTIGFQMAGFRTFTQFTYEIPPQTPEQVWEAMRSPRRTIIRGAQKKCTLERLTDPKEFMAFYDANLKKMGKRSYIDSKLSAKIIDEALARGRGAIYAAKENGALCAAIFCVWDAQAAYYLMTTRDPAAHSGAVSLVTFEAIKDAMAKNITFDLDGLFDEGGVAFFAGFGGQVAPRFIVNKKTPAYRVIDYFRALWEGESAFTL